MYLRLTAKAGNDNKPNRRGDTGTERIGRAAPPLQFKASAFPMQKAAPAERLFEQHIQACIYLIQLKLSLFFLFLLLFLLSFPVKRKRKRRSAQR